MRSLLRWIRGSRHSPGQAVDLVGDRDAFVVTPRLPKSYELTGGDEGVHHGGLADKMNTLLNFLRGNTVFSIISIVILASGAIWSLVNHDQLVSGRGYAVVVPIMAVVIGGAGLLIDLLMRKLVAKRKTVNIVQAQLLGLLVITIFAYRQTLLM
jgi:hypothetical protein